MYEFKENHIYLVKYTNGEIINTEILRYSDSLCNDPSTLMFETFGSTWYININVKDILSSKELDISTL